MPVYPNRLRPALRLSSSFTSRVLVNAFGPPGTEAPVGRCQARAGSTSQVGIMPPEFLIFATAGAAAVASPLGGLLALWHKPSTLFMSVSLGFASGVLLATVGFEMLPQATELVPLAGATAAFMIGFAAVYAFDLYIHRGRLAGKVAEQRPEVERFHRRHRSRGDRVTVLAGGTSIEELIEGLSIGVGAAIRPELGLMVALAIVIDNFAEALGIGELVRDRAHGRPARRILGWTSLIGLSLFAAGSLDGSPCAACRRPFSDPCSPPGPAGCST